MYKISLILCLLVALSAGSIGIIFFSPKSAACIEGNRHQDFYKHTDHPYTSHDDYIYDANEAVDNLYKIRIDDYWLNVETTHSSIQILAAFVVISLLVLFYRPKALEIPIISMRIPETLVYVFVSVSLLYFWVQFGLAMNASVDSRYALHYMTLMKEKNGCFDISYIYSARNSFVDSGIIDNWCGLYMPQVFGKDGGGIYDVISYLGLFGIFGVLFGVIHGACFIITDYLNQRANESILTRILCYFVMFMFLVSSICFVFKFEYSALFMGWVWAVAGLCVYLWKKIGIRIADKIEKSHTDAKSENPIQ